MLSCTPGSPLLGHATLVAPWTSSLPRSCLVLAKAVRSLSYLDDIIMMSRPVVAWQISNTLDGRFCLDALDLALAQGKPDIFNTDQGVQFTALAFTSRLKEAGIRISMDGRGRALDNVFVERLWRTVNYEHVYLHECASVPTCGFTCRCGGDGQVGPRVRPSSAMLLGPQSKSRARPYVQSTTR